MIYWVVRKLMTRFCIKTEKTHITFPIIPQKQNRTFLSSVTAAENTVFLNRKGIVYEIKYKLIKLLSCKNVLPL